jgi:uncharacterized protein
MGKWKTTTRSSLLGCGLILGVLPQGGCLSSWGAAALVRPLRSPLYGRPSLPYVNLQFSSGDVQLEGWLFRPSGPPRALVVYLHGKDNNRSFGASVAERLVPQGFAVLAYDQRAHGQSGGLYCTYGQQESADLSRVLDQVPIAPIYVIGHSLGGAVALRAASADPRIRALVVAASFSDLTLIVKERTPGFVPAFAVQEALARAEREAGFHIRDISPRESALKIRVPVLLIHGSEDGYTHPDHTRRLQAALPGPKRALFVDGASHNDVLAHLEVWRHIQLFLTSACPDGCP